MLSSHMIYSFELLLWLLHLVPQSSFCWIGVCFCLMSPVVSSTVIMVSKQYPRPHGCRCISLYCFSSLIVTTFFYKYCHKILLSSDLTITKALVCHLCGLLNFRDGIHITECQHWTLSKVHILSCPSTFRPMNRPPKKYSSFTPAIHNPVVPPLTVFTADVDKDPYHTCSIITVRYCSV